MPLLTSTLKLSADVHPPDATCNSKELGNMSRPYRTSSVGAACAPNEAIKSPETAAYLNGFIVLNLQVPFVN